MGTLEERWERVKAAIALDPVDKTPFISGAAACAAAFTNTTVKDFISDPVFNVTCNIKCAEMMGEVDGIQAATSIPFGLPVIWLSRIAVPGEDIPDNELWQVAEAELITQDDYDTILEAGFEPWYQDFMKSKLGDPLTRLAPFGEYNATAIWRFEDAGFPVVKDGSLLTPFEMLCGGRSMEAFLVDDIFDIPEKLTQVFKLIHEYNMARYEARFSDPTKRPFGVWVGGWRGTPSALNPEMFETFAWPYFADLVDLCIQYNVVPIAHLDSSWDRGLHYFRQFPEKKVVMALDGQTDIRAAKEVVGDKMCIMGDVPATLLAFDTAENTYDYCRALIRDIGPTGFMLCSGCDIPFNAKLENVQMMSKACVDAGASYER